MKHDIFGWLRKIFNSKLHMGIRLGPFDPIQLVFNLINLLMKKGVITPEESESVIKLSLPTEWTVDQKDEFFRSITKPNE
ncbi:MAG: hypothetical protein U9Q03_04670 [Patescibacteria group bacterium]|nr:hypothetical protein [Patescibacteria group bacterium]